MRRLLLALSTFPLLAGPAGAAETTAGVVHEMTPENIALALVTGKNEHPARYFLRTHGAWVEFSTPFLRLAQKAAEAHAQRLLVEASLASPDVVAPELRVSVGPETIGDSAPAVSQILLEPAAGGQIAPRSSEVVVEYGQSNRRKKIKLQGLKAVFPIEAFTAGTRFRVILSKGAPQVLEPPADWFAVPR